MKISINMLSLADKVKGQGVGSAYSELIKLLNKHNDFKIVKNKGLNYDIMHMHTVDISSYVKQRLSKGVSLTYVHFMPNTLDGSIKLPKVFLNIYAWWVKKCYLNSDYLVVVNPIYIDEMVKMGYPKERIFYIPNVVSNDSFYVIDEDLRSEYGYNKEDFIVMASGQLHKGKGVLEFAKIAKENPNIKFIWVGGFNFGKFMEGYKEIKEIYDNPPSNLKITGVVERSEVNRYCNISNVFFLPSFYESFSLVALEAALTEKPVILRDLPIYKTLYNDNFLYGKNNSEFIELIRRLKDDKRFYKERVEKSKKVKEEYSEEEIYKKWKELYTTISR